MAEFTGIESLLNLPVGDHRDHALWAETKRRWEDDKAFRDGVCAIWSFALNMTENDITLTRTTEMAILESIALAVVVTEKQHG